MSILLSCRCGKALRVGDELSGKRIKCPGCGQPLLVEAASRPVEEAVESDERRERRFVQQPVDEWDETRRRARSDDEEELAPFRKSIAKPKSNAAVWIALGSVGALCLGVVALVIILNSGEPDARKNALRQDDWANAPPEQGEPALQIDEKAEGSISLSNRGLTISGTAVQIGLVEKKELEKLLGPMDRVVDLKIGRADLIGIWDKRGIRCYISQINQRVSHFDLFFDPKASEVPQLTPENPLDQVFKLDGVEVTKATTKQHLAGRTSRPMLDYAGNRPGVHINYAKHHVSLDFTKDRSGLIYVRISVNPEGVFGGKR